MVENKEKGKEGGNYKNATPSKLIFCCCHRAFRNTVYLGTPSRTDTSALLGIGISVLMERVLSRECQEWYRSQYGTLKFRSLH